MSSMSLHLLQGCLNFDFIENCPHSILLMSLQSEGFGNHVQLCRYYKSRRNSFMREKMKNVSSISLTVLQFSTTGIYNREFSFLQKSN